jgi:hypothetical protein
MKIKDFKVSTYKNVNGKYEVHICVDKPAGGCHSWNYERTCKEYPIEMETFAKHGFTNKSRDLFLLEYGFSHTYTTKKEAQRVHDLYQLILDGIKLNLLK